MFSPKGPSDANAQETLVEHSLVVRNTNTFEDVVQDAVLAEKSAHSRFHAAKQNNMASDFRQRFRMRAKEKVATLATANRSEAQEESSEEEDDGNDPYNLKALSNGGKWGLPESVQSAQSAQSARSAQSAQSGRRQHQAFRPVPRLLRRPVRVAYGASACVKRNRLHAS